MPRRHVVLQRSGLSEAQITFFADVRSFARVDPLMLPQIVLTQELLFARQARIIPGLRFGISHYDDGKFYRTRVLSYMYLR